MSECVAIIIDAQELLRSSIAGSIRSVGRFSSVIESESVAEALGSIIRRVAPAVMCLDYETSWKDLCSRFPVPERMHSDVRPVVLGGPNDPTTMVVTLKRGAYAYLPKSARIADVAQAMHDAAQGRRTVLPVMAAEFIAGLSHDQAHCGGLEKGSLIETFDKARNDDPSFKSTLESGASKDIIDMLRDKAIMESAIFRDSDMQLSTASVRRRKHMPSKLDVYQLFISETIESCPGITIAQIREQLLRQFGVSISSGALHTFLHRHGLMLKKVSMSGPRGKCSR